MAKRKGGYRVGRLEGRITSDVGRWAPVPEWLLLSEASDKALRLFAVLGIYADYSTNEADLGRKQLAAMIGSSVDTVDRAKAELVKFGALEVERRDDEHGRVANHYRLRYAAPARRGGRMDAAGGGRTDAAPLTGKTFSDKPSAPNGAALTPIQQLVGAVVDEYHSRSGGDPLPRQTKGQLAQQIAKLEREGFPFEQIVEGCVRMFDRQRIVPSSLANFVAEARLPAGRARKLDPENMTAEQLGELRRRLQEAGR